jgi:RND family efflux transporter MFP subunit
MKSLSGSNRPQRANHAAGRESARANGHSLPFVIAAALWLSTGPGPAAAAELPLAEVVVDTVKREQSFDGVLEAVNQSTVSAEISGRIIALPYDVDDYVPQGDVIVRFHDTEQQARLDSARANLEDARARLHQAEVDYQRMRTLLDKGTVSTATFDRAEAEYKSARARVDAARAQLDQANEELERTVVRAPYSGVVTARHVELGEMASPGTPLMTGLSLEHLRAVVDVPQQFIGALREHQEAQILTPNGDSVRAEALRIFPYANETTHTFRVRAALPQGQHGAFPGMLVKVVFTTGERDVLLVPVEAVVRRGELTAVYVQDTATDGALAFRQIRAGREFGERVEVLAGLESGEKVVLDPVAAGIAYKATIRAPEGTGQ